MPGAHKPRAPYYQDYDDQHGNDNERDTDSPKASGNKKQESKSKEDGAKDGKAKGGGWLGGILTKLSLRPPNQMILPDDKNPTIVWDAETKRWRNLDGDADESDQPPPPPPRSSDLPHALSPPAAQPPAPGAPGAPPAAPVSNIFKMQKGRHIKKSYVDVFNPSGAATRARPPASEVLGPAAPPPAPASYFVPAPVPTESEVERPEAIEVMIPPSPSPSYSETPPPSPIPDPEPYESGLYEPSTLEGSDPYERSGI